MPMDENYKELKFLIESGEITEFSQIFKHFKKKIVAADLKTSTRHLSRIQRMPNLINFDEVFAFSREFDVDMDLMYKIIKQQFLAQKSADLEKNKAVIQHI
jgi:hypothetical protein